MVLGSDLKWWKINPCDNTKDRNLFQGIHKCDQETTIVRTIKIKDKQYWFLII